MLGLNWIADGLARLWIDDAINPGQRGLLARAKRLTASGPASSAQGHRISVVGLWGFGLDSIYGWKNVTDAAAFFDMTVASARWQSNLEKMNWQTTLPFSSVNPVFDNASDSITISGPDASVFLTTMQRGTPTNCGCLLAKLSPMV
jgi:hypothetical protein